MRFFWDPLHNDRRNCVYWMNHEALTGPSSLTCLIDRHHLHISNTQSGIERAIIASYFIASCIVINWREMDFPPKRTRFCLFRLPIFVHLLFRSPILLPHHIMSRFTTVSTLIRNIPIGIAHFPHKYLEEFHSQNAIKQTTLFIRIKAIWFKACDANERNKKPSFIWFYSNSRIDNVVKYKQRNSKTERETGREILSRSVAFKKWVKEKLINREKDAPQSAVRTFQSQLVLLLSVWQRMLYVATFKKATITTEMCAVQRRNRNCKF